MNSSPFCDLAFKSWMLVSSKWPLTCRPNIHSLPFVLEYSAIGWHWRRKTWSTFSKCVWITCHSWEYSSFVGHGPTWWQSLQCSWTLVWNYLLTDLRQPDLSYSHLRQLQKTFLFGQWDQNVVWIPLKLLFINPLLNYVHQRSQRSIVVRPTTALAISTDIIRQTIVQHCCTFDLELTATCSVKLLNCDSLSLLSNPDLKLFCFILPSVHCSTYLFRQHFCSRLTALRRFINFVFFFVVLLLNWQLPITHSHGSARVF